MRQGENYTCTVEKAHGQLEKRMEGTEKHRNGRKTIRDEKGKRKEYQYYLSSLGLAAETFKRALEHKEYALASGCDIM